MATPSAPRPGVSSETWQPSYPGQAVGTGALYDKAPDSGAPYEQAPAGSHVYGWKLLTGGFVSKFYAPSAGAGSDTKAVLTVAFKDKSGGLGTVYEYYFISVPIAQNYLEKFRGAQHPGHVVQQLITDRVPYKRVH
jgi:hypothetical protein